jgi:hypothetical protein
VPYDPTIYLGSAAHYRCGRPAYSPGLDAVLAQEAGLDGNFFVPGIPDLLRDSESVLSAWLSLSSSAPHLFGDRLDDFAAEVRALLANRAAEGIFWDWPGDTEVVIVRNDPPAQARQQAYLNALRAKSGSRLQIVYGRYQAKQQQCRACGATWTSYEEKETDVNIAVSLVADAASSSADLALVISADSDLCPAIIRVRARL